MEFGLFLRTKTRTEVTMLSGQNMLLAANIAVWTGIALYVLGLGRRHVRLERRLRQLEIARAEQEQP